MDNNLSFKTVQDLLNLDVRQLNVVRVAMPEDSTVKFGETGKGIRPNYQLCLKNGVIIPCLGSYSKYIVCQRVSAFDPENVSRPFSRAEIDTAIAQLHQS